MSAYYLFLLVLFMNLVKLRINGDLFTSTANMESLVLTERDLTLALHRYLETEQARLTALKQFLQKTDATLEQVNKTSVGKFIGNPINSYLMLKRFSIDWKNMEDLVTKDYSEGTLIIV